MADTVGSTQWSFRRLPEARARAIARYNAFDDSICNAGRTGSLQVEHALMGENDSDARYIHSDLADIYVWGPEA